MFLKTIEITFLVKKNLNHVLHLFQWRKANNNLRGCWFSKCVSEKWFKIQCVSICGVKIYKKFSDELSFLKAVKCKMMRNYKQEQRLFVLLLCSHDIQGDSIWDIALAYIIPGVCVKCSGSTGQTKRSAVVVVCCVTELYEWIHPFIPLHCFPLLFSCMELLLLCARDKEACVEVYCELTCGAAANMVFYWLPVTGTFSIASEIHACSQDKKTSSARACCCAQTSNTGSSSRHWLCYLLDFFNVNSRLHLKVAENSECIDVK